MLTKVGLRPLLAGLAATCVGLSTAHAQVTTETAFILNSLLFLIGGFLVMFMAAGFCMLEAGLVRTKNVADICLKNIVLYSIAGLMYYVIGYQLMYSGVAEGSGWIGVPGIWAPTMENGERAITEGYAEASDWFFQMVFVATAASIVSGAVAERIKISSFFIFVAVLTGIIYPIQGAWSWGGGYLAGIGFSDFAGSTIVHSVGGWAALTGVLILGPRIGKYAANGRTMPMPGSNLPLATIGTFILWLGWFGFNGASQLAMGSAADVIAISHIFANTNMAAAGGATGAAILTKILYRKIDLTLVLNGALAGLVSITAEPLTPAIGEAILIGAVGGVIVTFAIPLLDKLRIDDVVGAIPVHLVAGIFGTLVVPLTNPEAGFVPQLIGIGVVAAWTIVTSAIVWFALKFTLGIRLSAEDEVIGSDLTELGLDAYPEFGDRAGVSGGGSATRGTATSAATHGATA